LARKDRTGEVYGRLTVIEHSHTKRYSTSKQTVQHWLCRCTCGNTVTVSSNSLNSGGTRSCGCIRKEEAARRRLEQLAKNPNRGLSKTQEYDLWSAAKERSVRFGREFSIAVSDIVIPKMCPVLGIPLFKGNGKQSGNSPTLDRIDTTRGYTKDNVAVISLRANSLKQDATVEVLEKLIKYIKKEL